MVRISGNLPPHLQSEADLPFHMQGSASPSGEPICALMDSVTSTTPLRVSIVSEAMKTVDEGAGQEAQAALPMMGTTYIILLYSKL